MTDAPVDISNNEQRRRWEARLGEAVVGYSEYRNATGRIVFTHTVVDPEFEGRGIGSRLARAALDDAIARNLRITPYCPFIRAYVRRHPEFAGSVDMPEPR